MSVLTNYLPFILLAIGVVVLIIVLYVLLVVIRARRRRRPPGRVVRPGTISGDRFSAVSLPSNCMSEAPTFATEFRGSRSSAKTGPTAAGCSPMPDCRYRWAFR